MQVMTMEEAMMVSGGMSETQCIGGTSLGFGIIGGVVGGFFGGPIGAMGGAGLGLGGGAALGGLVCRYLSE